MLKSVEGIYAEGEIVLAESPEGIPINTKVIVTFLTDRSASTNQSNNKILSNQEIAQILDEYRQLQKPRPMGLGKGEFHVPDNFNEPLPDEILALFE